ncbi:MAG: recombination mediator RecR [Alphaproteobacteria bacterium]|nr:recombination mediator RecR [Alphaproteobacteria bacterium]
MNPQIEKLIKMFAKLPRVGNRAAQRIVLALLQDKTGRANALSEMLSVTANTIHPCKNCGVLTDKDTCEFCSSTERSNGQLCVVRDMSDVWVIEKSGFYSGRYHITGGVISGTNGTMPDDLNIASISSRIKQENINEIIFALPNTVEGKTTQSYIMSVVGENSGVAFTELASGMPLGGDLDYIDDGTLTLAFGGRKKL